MDCIGFFGIEYIVFFIFIIWLYILGMVIDKMKQIDKNVTILINLQNSIQRQYAELFLEYKDKNRYNHTGIFIKTSCKCGREYITPYAIRSNGVCSNCHRYMFVNKEGLK